MRTIQRGRAGFEVADVGFRVANEGEFWDSFADGSWEPYTTRLLERLVAPGMRVMDIGAWRGPVTLTAAALGAEVHAFEPDPLAFKGLKLNVEANDTAFRSRVHLHNKAVTHDGRPIALFARYGFGDSGSSMLSRLQDTGGAVQVASTTFDAYVREQGFDRIDFVKMDIEGGEFFTLPAMRAALVQYRPILYLSTHGPLLVEYLEKQRARSGLVRRACRLLGIDPLARSRRAAVPLINDLVESLSVYPYVYSRDLVPVDPARIGSMMDELTEFVFSPRELGY